MRTVSSLKLILMLGGVKCALSSELPMAAVISPSFLSTGDLFLTPLIEKNEIEKARSESLVHIFKYVFNVDAYSGFITINNSTNSNLFFLLTVAEGNTSDAPLLLWTQGGPGQSALFGQFLQNGPVAFNYSKNESFPFTSRDNTLQKNMSIIYLDLPVGAGFSFTENKTAYATSLQEISDSVMKFLDQFLKLFPWYVCRDLYVAGESYGARYSVAIADAFISNKKNVLLQLKGIISGNGFLGPILETADSSDFLYWTSMVNETGRQNLSDQFKLMRDMMGTEKEKLIPGMLLQTIFADLEEINKTLFQNLTSYNDHASPLFTTRPRNIIACFLFLRKVPFVKQMFHVGQNRVFEYFNPDMATNLAPDLLKDISNITQRVLNNSNVLMYTGQLDALFPSVKQRIYYSTLNWTYSEKYRKTQRTPWRPQTWDPYRGYAGFIKQVPNFTEAVLLEMSHYGGVEKPDEVYYLMMDFIFNWTRNT